MNPTYSSERINGGKRRYLSVSNAHIQRHTGALSSWAPVHSQHETSLDLSLQASVTQRGGPLKIVYKNTILYNI